MKALTVMRMEKGFITHAEIDGRSTAFYIGMQGMMSGKKDFIGKAMAARPGLVDALCAQLVALKPVDAVKELIAGAHLLLPGAESASENDEGYINPGAFSPMDGVLPMEIGGVAPNEALAKHAAVVDPSDTWTVVDMQGKLAVEAFARAGARVDHRAGRGCGAGRALTDLVRSIGKGQAMFRRTVLGLAALCLAPQAWAAGDKSVICTETAKVVQVAVTERARGRDADGVKRQLTTGAGKVEARLTPMVAPLVDWVFTLDTGEIGAPNAARTVTEKYHAGCMGFER